MDVEMDLGMCVEMDVAMVVGRYVELDVGNIVRRHLSTSLYVVRRYVVVATSLRRGE